MTNERKKLVAVREQTGCGYSVCQQALAKSGGDVSRAVDLIRSSGETYTTADARVIKSIVERVRLGKRADESPAAAADRRRGRVE